MTAAFALLHSCNPARRREGSGPRELDQATTAWLAYRDAEQAWVDAEPASQEAQIELSYAYNSLGTARLDSADLNGAIQYFRRSIELKRKGLAQAAHSSATPFTRSGAFASGTTAMGASTARPWKRSSRSFHCARTVTTLASFTWP